MSATASKSHEILGVRVDPLTRWGVVEWATGVIDKELKAQYLLVINVAKLVKARRDAQLHGVIRQATLVAADGMPIVWASRLNGKSLPERVSGIDVMFDLLREGNKRSWSFYFFGATPEVICSLAERVQVDYPEIRLAGYRDGYFLQAQEEEIVKEIASSQANILFLGFGSPMKENFVERWRDVFNVNIIHGVGGSFDIYAGKTKRAPAWMQEMGLEWFFRLMQEPVRMFPRYFYTNSVFLWLVLKEIIKLPFRRKSKKSPQT